jgi:ribose 5-phosphate isomerase B
MKIAVGADHAGLSLKQRLLERLRAQGHEVADFGTNSPESTDYPDYAAAVGSSGVGMSIAANKIRGVRAALGANDDEVSYTRRHNDANVLALGAKYTPPEDAERMLDTFLNTEFEGGRHARRVEKIKLLEQEQA